MNEDIHELQIYRNHLKSLYPYSEVTIQAKLKLLGRYLPALKLEAGGVLKFFETKAEEWTEGYLRKVRAAIFSYLSWQYQTRRSEFDLAREIPTTKNLVAPRKHPARIAERSIYFLFRQYLRTESLAAGTIEQRVGDIQRMCKSRDPLTFSSVELADYLSSNQDWAREYKRKIRSSLCVFYRWAHNLGLIDNDPSKELRALSGHKTRRVPITEEELQSAYESAYTLYQRTILALAGSLGLRRSEIASLHPSMRSGRLLTVRGKGDKLRVIPLNEQCYRLLLDLEDRRESSEQYYFPGRFGSHVHPSTIYKQVKPLLGEKWCLHSLRHRTATQAVKRTKNLRGVQELLGHASLATTAIYVNVTLEELHTMTASTEFSAPPVTELQQSGDIRTVDLYNLTSEDVRVLSAAISRSLNQIAA